MRKKFCISWIINILIAIVFVVGICMVSEGDYIVGSIIMVLDLLFFAWFTLFESK